MFKYTILCSLLIICINSFAQQTVRGVVTSEDDNSGLPGVNVLIKGTTNGTATDIDGNYSIQANPEDVLIFSFIGFAKQEMTVGSRSVIDVVLESDVASLDEIIVVGYGVQKKSVATASVSKVEAEDLQGFSIARADQALQGQVAGVTFKSASGQPGSDMNILIRGVGTNGDNGPLVIVDGLVTSPEAGILSSLNPGDIESVQVLKDGASTAIYGSRAANGIIMVTTKKAKEGQVRFNYDVNYGVSEAWRTPDMLNASEYIEIINEKYASGNQSPPPNFPDEASNLFDTDWMDQIFEQGKAQTHQVSIAKGSETGSFYASLSYFEQEGIVAPDKSNAERITARVNSETKINDFLSFGQNIFLLHSTNSRIPENSEFGTPIGDALVYDPTTPALDPNSLYGFAQSPFVQKEYISPLSRIFVSNDETIQDGVTGNIYLQVTPIEGLTLKTDLGVEYNIFNGSGFTPSYQFTDIFGDGLPVSNELNDISRWSSKVFLWQWENYATYSRSIGKHNAEVTVGVSAQEKNENSFSAGSSGIAEEVQLDPNFQFITGTPDSLNNAGSEAKEKQAISSIFGRINYNFDEKYLATFILRRDGSTQFGANFRYGVFPSASLGWVISQEDFWPQTAVNFLKLRASYGVNGNDRIDNLSFASTIEFSGDYQFGPKGGQVVYNGQSPKAADNPNVKWEESKHLDIGIEGGLFNDQLTFELDYYEKTTSDLLMEDTGSPIRFGFDPPIRNVGEVVNKGFELELNYRQSIGELNLNFGFNGSTLKNEVTKVNADGFIDGYSWPIRNTRITRMEVGRPIGYFRGYKTDGIFRSENEVFAHIGSTGDPLQPSAVPGDLRFVDVNGDGLIDAEDITEIGKPWADIMLGLNIGATYKNFDLRVLFSSSIGNDIFRSYERQDVINNNYNSEWLDRWSETNPNGSYPRITISDVNNNSRPSDFYVEDGSYLRLRNLQLGYSLPSSILEKIHASKLRLYVSVDNLLTITGYTGLDPEIGTSGWILDTSIDKGFYPQTRTIAVGANFSF